MAVDFSDFICWADDEATRGESAEFPLRNASSRAYYALYHAAATRAKALTIPIIRVEKAGSHEALIQAIRTYSPKGKSLADDMERTKKFRHRCDYDLDTDVRPEKALKQISEVKRLIDLLSRL